MALVDADIKSLAEAFTVVASRLFREVKASDLISRVESLGAIAKDVPSGDPPKDSLMPIIEMSNEVVEWMIRTLVTETDAARRASILDKFVSLAVECHRLQNDATLVDLVIAFKTLRSSTKSMPDLPDLDGVLSECQDILPPNFSLGPFEAKAGVPRVPPLPAFIFAGVNNDDQQHLVRTLQRLQEPAYDIQADAALVSLIENAFVKEDYKPESTELEDMMRNMHW